ncbi:TPA: hypothetical protein ACPUJE_003019 [Klebsiella pneumoniae]|uniref:hypothetical protein n=1 Tax=Klebsiella pneumoniae TaxID=573 RepID=UPI001BA1698E|nr:hypothetical protein [Klebsiella pneumoniae]HBC9086178.1 hypothetical protein [Citrobacter koseri]HBX6008381.1 hypothetical protein [Klebsiella pneumoniae]HBX6228165.1 hypothetical protein [Klebsiella pneumoniae]HBY6581635.1 hypothetical protein [Klebsiella pneumoniae]
MTNNEVLTLLVSGAALLVSGYSAIQYRLANENAKKALIKADEAHSTQKAALSLQEAALESQITSSIATAAGMVQQAALALSNIAESAHNYGIFKKNYTTAQEVWLNAHDQACMSYREDKLNKGTFKKTYQVPIRSIVESEDLEHFFNPADSSKYQSILNVYREWETSQR